MLCTVPVAAPQPLPLRHRSFTTWLSAGTEPGSTSGVRDSLKQGCLSEAYKDVFTACPTHHAAIPALSIRSELVPSQILWGSSVQRLYFVGLLLQFFQAANNIIEPVFLFIHDLCWRLVDKFRISEFAFQSLLLLGQLVDLFVQTAKLGLYVNQPRHGYQNFQMSYQRRRRQGWFVVAV